MIEAYTVGTVLKLQDLVSAPLLKIATNLEKMDVIAVALNKNLKAIGAESAGIKAVDAATSSMNRHMGMVNIQAERLEHNLAKIKAMGVVLPSGPGGTLPVIPVMPRAVRASGGHTGIHAEGARFGSEGFAMGSASVGLGAFGAVAAGGAAAIYVGHKFYEAAKEFDLEYNKFKALGLSDAQNTEALAFVKHMKTFGVSMTQNMTLFRDAQTVFRDSNSLEHAKVVTPVLAKMHLANSYLGGEEHAGQMEKKFMDFLRVIELRRGLNSPEEFMRQANMVQQVLTSSGGRVDPTQMLNLMKTGGVAAKALSNQALYYQLEPMIQEMGGGRVGTSLMSAYQNLILGRTSVQVAKELNRIGLLDPKHVEYNKIGMIKRILPGGLKGGEVLSQSPVDWMEKVMLPAFRAKGITQEKDVLQEIGLIFSNRAASNLFSSMYLQMGNIRKGEAMTAGAKNIDQVVMQAKASPQGKEAEFWAAWQDFKVEFNKNILPAVTSVFVGLANLLRGVNSLSENNPKLWNFLMFIASPGIPSSDRAAAAVGFTTRSWNPQGINGEQANQFFGNSSNDYVGSGKVQPIQVHSTVNLDGRKVGESVTTHISNALNRRSGASGSAFDPTLSPTPTNLAYAR